MIIWISMRLCHRSLVTVPEESSESLNPPSSFLSPLNSHFKNPTNTNSQPTNHRTQIQRLPTTPKRTRPRTRTSHRHHHHHHHTHSYINSPKKRQHTHRRGDSEVTVSSLVSVPPSPLESTAVIRPIIPPRTSSLRNAGVRRFRLPSLAPSLTLSTLPSLPSLISLSRQRRRKRSGGQDKGKGKEIGKGKGKMGRSGSRMGEDQDDEEEEGIMTATTTESNIIGDDAGDGIPMVRMKHAAVGRRDRGQIRDRNLGPLSAIPRLHLPHSSQNQHLSPLLPSTYKTTNASTARFGSPLKHHPQTHHPAEPMPTSATATRFRFPPRSDSLSSISFSIPTGEGPREEVSLSSRDVADGRSGAAAGYRNAEDSTGFSVGGDGYSGNKRDNHGSNREELTSAESISVEYPSSSSLFPSSGPLLPAPSSLRFQSSTPFLSSSSATAAATPILPTPAYRSPPTAQGQGQNQGRASLAGTSMLPRRAPHTPQQQHHHLQQQHRPIPPQPPAGRSPVSPSIPIPTPVPVPIALAFRPERRRHIISGNAVDIVRATGVGEQQRWRGGEGRHSPPPLSLGIRRYGARRPGMRDSGDDDDDWESDDGDGGDVDGDGGGTAYGDPSHARMHLHSNTMTRDNNNTNSNVLSISTSMHSGGDGDDDHGPGSSSSRPLHTPSS